MVGFIVACLVAGIISGIAFSGEEYTHGPLAGMGSGGIFLSWFLFGAFMCFIALGAIALIIEMW